MRCALATSALVDHQSTLFLIGGKMANHQVLVTYNGEGAPLGIGEPLIDLEAGDTVEWVFQNVPLGDLVYIHFNDPSNQPFGPFQALQPAGNSVKGIGNSGVPGAYSYTALVLDQSGPIAISEVTASIINLSIVMDTVSETLGSIVYIPGDPPAVQVKPHILRMQGRDTAIWLVEGLREDFFLTFRFDDFPDSMTGPFRSFSLSRAFGTTRLAIGTNFDGDLRTQGEPLAQITYFVEARDSQGVVIASHDPVIEPLGSPPNP
jgi:hypothetical protein